MGRVPPRSVPFSTCPKQVEKIVLPQLRDFCYHKSVMANGNPVAGTALPNTGFALVDQLIAWWRRPIPPDPWGEELDSAVRQEDATPVCPRCFEPQPPVGWFCPQCGAAVGHYNTSMPYVYVHSLGEMLLSGVGRQAQYTLLTIPGYVLVAVSEYGPLGLIYLVRVFRNMGRLQRTDTAPADTGSDSSRPGLKYGLTRCAAFASVTETMTLVSPRPNQSGHVVLRRIRT